VSQLRSTHTSENGFSPRPQISHVIFDFDGTLSWLRHGWPEIMAGIFLKRLPAGTRQAIHETLLADILSLNGKSSIFQMERCAERVRENGGPNLDPGEMLKEYATMLHAAVRERIERLKRGEAKRDDFVVFGARDFLETMRARGLIMIILSGTEESQVKYEADLLGLAPFFGAHIYGGTANLVQSSKQAVIDRLMREEKIPGERLLSFGDGPVEIRLTKQAGGLAVGVASDEDVNGSGKLHPQKVPQLREAGADLLIPDYRDPEVLMTRLIGPGEKTSP
jgi:phosphoglycolate phosphatase-like HAD superfamily hydrolase